MKAPPYPLWRYVQPQKRKEKPRHAGDLRTDVRLVLGIWTSCMIRSAAEVSKAIHMPLVRVQRIIKAIYDSNHPVVISAVQEGLPLKAAVKLPWDHERLLCETCHQQLSMVPCPVCMKGSAESREQRIARLRFMKELPEHKLPTTFTPGSKQKIHLMRERIESGFSAFHEQDASLEERELFVAPRQHNYREYV